MEPHEIRPDTELCTIIGYNAQTGPVRKVFNKILKQAGKNATAIALNLKDDNFDFTMQKLPESKIDRVLVEWEFRQKALRFCEHLNDEAKKEGYVDFIEKKEGKLYGFAIKNEALSYFKDPSLIDEGYVFVMKMMLIANRWYDTPVQIDQVPLLAIK